MTNNLERVRAHDVCERLYISVRSLATGKGDVRERLADLSATLLPLRLEDFPTKLQPEYNWIVSRLKRHPARHKHESCVDATCKRMQNRTGQAIAERIVLLYEKAMHIQGKTLI